MKFPPLTAYLIAALAPLLLVLILNAQQSSIAIENVPLIDGRPAKPNTCVLVTGNRITTVGPCPLPVPADARRINGTGKFLIPGLMDVHVQLRGGEGFDAKERFFALREEERTGKIVAPRAGHKIFSPHMGFQCEALECLPTFREVFIPDEPPAKIEVGTFVYENVAGIDAAVSYLEQLGKKVSPTTGANSRRANMVRVMEVIGEYEASLSLALFEVLGACGGNLWPARSPVGPAARAHILLQSKTNRARDGRGRMGASRNRGARWPDIFAAPDRAPGTQPGIGAVPVSLLHYNTPEEIQRFGRFLGEMVREKS